VREVSLTWDSACLSTTNFVELSEIVESIQVIAHLEISPLGVKQLVSIKFKPGKSTSDLDSITFLSLVDTDLQPSNNLVAIWNNHPLVALSSSAQDIHIIPPYRFENGAIFLKVRGLPKAISEFVKLSELWMKPTDVKVSDIEVHQSSLYQNMTERQHECFALASQYGYYDEPKRITIAGMASLLNISRSTFQEHLKNAEQIALRWLTEQFVFDQETTND